ncbi:MAG: hypothetical protein Q9174_001524 [Haloplaca sp. 1 TL-2023]
MASSRGPPHATSSFSPNNNFDTLDMDQFINFDPSHVLPTPSYSPELARSASISTPNPSMEYIDNLHLAPSPQQTFAGPSHQYELHKQQTGLPVGALANTFAINQADHMVYGHAQRMLGSNPSDTYSEDLFNFNTAPAPYRSMGSDMDLDFNSPLDVPSHYVDPTTVSGQESSVSSVPTKQRAWPGMHQRQAAMKAQAEAQQQQQQHKQQTATHQRHASASQQSTQRPLVNAPPAKDPIVEERISRLLNQMRHESVSSSNDDTATPTAQAGSAHLGRGRKDEEDMDEDERLLASEEGKKLSSKERRQLRNKVSARAFRSRRKEYIGQLEGELAAKTSEADDLRSKNQKLMNENTQLADLTRMLLSSPAFTHFLNTMSPPDGKVNTSLVDLQQQTVVPKTEEPQTQPSIPKDTNPHQPLNQSHDEQSDSQVGMVFMPDHHNAFRPANTTWTDNPDYALYNAQVFAVTSMPEGPAVDQLGASIFSGKSGDLIKSFVDDEAKQDAPLIACLPPTYESSKEFPTISPQHEVPEDFSVKPTCPADLYDEVLDTHTSPTPRTKELADSDLSSEKDTQPIKLTLIDDRPNHGEVSTLALRRFLQFCANMEEPSQQVASITSHLS